MTVPHIPVPGSLRLNSNWRNVGVLAADDDILAVNKPSGLLSVRDRWDAERENLVDLLQALSLGYLANAHRLDRETSGVFLLARNRAALSSLVRQFRERTSEKTYLALVNGTPAQSPMSIEEPIAPDPHKEGLSRTLRSGKPARTDIEVVEQFRHFSLVRARPLTGRLHQVRVHLKSIGCPIVADADYGDGRPLLLSRIKRGYKSSAPVERPLLGRLALHAGTLSIAHPAAGARITLEAPLPDDLSLALKQLRKYGQ